MTSELELFSTLFGTLFHVVFYAYNVCHGLYFLSLYIYSTGPITFIAANRRTILKKLATHASRVMLISIDTLYLTGFRLCNRLLVFIVSPTLRFYLLFQSNKILTLMIYNYWNLKHSQTVQNGSYFSDLFSIDLGTKARTSILYCGFEPYVIILPWKINPRETTKTGCLHFCVVPPTHLSIIGINTFRVLPRPL